MHPYIPHTPEDEKEMLNTIGISSMDDLYNEVPQSMRLGDSVPLPEGKAETEVIEEIRELADSNKKGTCFLGRGSYDHVVTSVGKYLSSLPEFVTAYTPYQAEISQGLLEAIFEYQSMMVELTGMDVSNASLYDGASAGAEAASIMIGKKRKSKKVLVSETVNPFTIETIKTWAFGQNIEIAIIPSKEGIISINNIKDNWDDETAGLIAQTPNRYGLVEDYSEFAEYVHENKGLFAISADPLSLGLYKTPGEWGADIAFGDTQPLGISLGFGGPYCGYMCVTENLMRKIPGRIVGRTTDNNGNTAYVLTLQAREQHIKRGRASSNICSNESLASIMTCIHLSTLGLSGVEEAANQSYSKSHYLASKLSDIGYKLAFDGPFWCEFTLEFSNSEELDSFVNKMKEKGIFAGVKDRVDSNLLVVCVTEKRTLKELNKYIEEAGRIKA